MRTIFHILQTTMSIGKILFFNKMEKYKPQSLEKESEKPDWKQWIPVFGIYKICRANFVEKAPAIDNDPTNHPIRYYGSAVYHAVTTVGVACGLVKLIEKLF